MIVSLTVYYIICGLVVLLLLSPFFYFRFIKGIKKDRDFTALLALFIVPFNWVMPPVITVTDCENYTKDVVIFPTNGYSLGKHSYVVNNSTSNLYFEAIVYGNDNPDVDDTIIKPGEIYDCPILHINYVLETPPSSVSIKGSGTVHYHLSCMQTAE